MGAREDKISGFFQFLSSQGFVEGKDYGLAQKGKFYLSEEAKKLINSPIGEEWLDSADRFSIPMIDVENSPEPIKTILESCQVLAKDFAEENDYAEELMLDILSGVVVQHQDVWTFDHFRQWSAKLIRFHRVKAVDFPALFFWTNRLFEYQRDYFFRATENS